MNTDPRELHVRLERLEKQNKTLKRWGAGLALGLGLLGLASAKLVCDTVSGERLVLHDPSGKTRVMVDAYGSDSPSLVFQNREGRPTAKIGVDEKSGELVLNVFDAKGGAKASWTLGKDSPKTQEAVPAKKADGPVSIAR